MSLLTGSNFNGQYGQPFSPCVQNRMGQKRRNQHRGYLKEFENEMPYRKWPNNDILPQLVPSWYPTCKIRCLMNQPPDAWLCPWLSQPKQNLLTTDLKGDINVLLTVQWMPLLSSSKAENKRPNIGYDWAIQFFKNCWLHRNWLTFDLGYGKGDDRDSICSLDWKRDVDQY